MPKSRRERRLCIVLLRALVAFGLVAAACVDDDELATQRKKAERYEEINYEEINEVEASTDTLAESGDVEVSVRFISFGDVDRSDGIPLGIVPDVKIAVIKDDDVPDWWASVTSIQDYISSTDYIPPGVQVRSSFDDISTAPAAFVTTDLDGTAETVLTIPEYQIHDYMFCAVSPVDEGLISGCSELQAVWRPNFDTLDITFYVYFSDGRAYIDRNSGRYQQFKDGTWASEGDSDDIATVFFVSIAYSDIGPPTFLRNMLVAVIKGEDIGDWWRTISGNEFSDRREVPLLNYYGVGIQFDPRVLGNTSAHIVNTGYDAIAEIELEPGDYLLCEADYGSINGCIYEYIVASQVYEYEISPQWEGPFSMGRQSEGYVERHLMDSRDWKFNG